MIPTDRQGEDDPITDNITQYFNLEDRELIVPGVGDIETRSYIKSPEFYSTVGWGMAIFGMILIICTAIWWYRVRKDKKNI